MEDIGARRLAEIDLPDRYRDRPRLASSEGEPGVEAVTVSEAIARHRDFGKLTSLVPGSWINANFNVWIGAPEDNRSWDYLYHARNFYAEAAPRATEAQRRRRW